MEEKKADLSIIILAYNSQPDLARLLPSVFVSEGVEFDHNNRGKYSVEIIIVDNGSADGTYEWLIHDFRGRENRVNIKIIKNQNVGFAAGNNIGIKEAAGKYILILNPDTEVKFDTLQVTLEFMDRHKDIGISTCKVILPDGKLDLACRRRFPTPWNSLLRLIRLSRTDYNMMDTDEDQSQEIDSCMGAFMLIRRKVIEKIGFLDEKFFMYGEDIDFCWRCKQAGFKVWYYPKASIIHYKGSASKKVSFKALKWFADAMWIFYKKHYRAKYPFILNWLIWLGIYFRLAFLLIANFFRKDKFVSKR